LIETGGRLPTVFLLSIKRFYVQKEKEEKDGLRQSWRLQMN
jgi:hypothetical protein